MVTVATEWHECTYLGLTQSAHQLLEADWPMEPWMGTAALPVLLTAEGE